MGEIIICPVCKKQIPADFLNCCFYCGFDLEKLSDEKCIEKAAERFCGYKLCVERSYRTLSNVLASVILGLLIVLMSLHACSISV